MRRKEKITFDEVVHLVDESKFTTDNLGNKDYSKVMTEVFCNVNSVDRNQFYDASTRGYKLSYVITLNEFEYNNEPKILYNDNEYEVVRTYLLDREMLEITVGEKIGDRV